MSVVVARLVIEQVPAIDGTAYVSARLFAPAGLQPGDRSRLGGVGAADMGSPRQRVEVELATEGTARPVHGQPRV